MAVVICEKRRRVLSASGHILVTGGPGCGKTTLAILRALRRIEAGLKDGQSVLFLSFSRAAVARILETAKQEIPGGHRRLLAIHTFHSFFWEILRTHGYLLGSPRRLTLLAPHDERALSNGIERDDQAWQAWEVERNRLFQEEGRTAFDLFAPKTRELLVRCARIRRIISNRYPLVIVDEGQDTGPDQWACVRALSEGSQLLCLADLEQQIFDYLPGIGPERVHQIEADLHPLRIDLGSENHRNPDSEIADFGYDILTGVSRGGSYRGVSQLDFSPKPELRDKRIRQSVGVVNKLVREKTGNPPQSIAILVSQNRGALLISKALRGGQKPIPHKVLFDEAPTLLSSRFLAFLMEPKPVTNQSNDLALTLELLSSVFRAAGTVTGLRRAQQLKEWALQTRNGDIPTRAALYSKLSLLLRNLQSDLFSGDPYKDWLLLRQLLRATNVRELLKVDYDLQYLMAFNRGRSIASGLSSLWENTGTYSSARNVLDAALAEDQILSGNEDLSGIHVMSIHKSKGKQFDAVIIFRSEYFPFTWRGDPHPYHRSRKILRVAITRARVHTLILNEISSNCPILSQYRL